MKKYLLIYLFFISSNICVSQSKIETEEWLKGKFNKWKIDIIDNDYKSTTEPLSLNFNNCNLEFKTKEYLYLATDPNYVTYTLHLGEIKEFEWFFFEGKNYFIITSNNLEVKKSIVYRNENKVTYVKGIVMGFNIDGEDSFKERMLKAFNHLKGFCPPNQKKKELF